MDIFDNTKIVVIGGGHGLGRTLSALNNFAHNATGIVTTTDNGGSTGRIRDCQGGIAWGDTRNCINQLIAEPTLSSVLFEYRFSGEGELHGHNLGNLMLTALDNLSVRPIEAINLIRNMLNVKVNLVPMSEQPVDLQAKIENGCWIHGETSVDELDQSVIELRLYPSVSATHEAIAAVNEADCIIIGPGSFLTSIMPPLLLPEIGKAIANNHRAKFLFIDNLAPEVGPAAKMDLSQKLSWCKNACFGRSIDTLIGQEYSHHSDVDCEFYSTDLASEKRSWRHDRIKLTNAIIAQLK